MTRFGILATCIFCYFTASSQAPVIQWDNTIGGTNYDYLTSTQATPDGGFIIGGYSKSSASGDKTEATVGGGTTYYDYWVLKLDADGNIEWQNTIGGTNDDLLNAYRHPMVVTF